MKCNLILCSSLFIFSIGCSPKMISTHQEEDYNEDVSQYHINYQDSLISMKEKAPSLKNEERSISGHIDTEYAITDQMNRFLNEITAKNREINEYQGVTLQVYSGPSRVKADEAMNKVYNILPDSEPRFNFDASNFKIRVGEYTDPMEAQKDYSALKGAFPLVVIIPEKFKVVD